MKRKVIEGIICAAVGMVAATMPVQASEAPAAADVVYTTTYVNARTERHGADYRLSFLDESILGL